MTQDDDTAKEYVGRMVIRIDHPAEKEGEEWIKNYDRPMQISINKGYQKIRFEPFEFLQLLKVVRANHKVVDREIKRSVDEFAREMGIDPQVYVDGEAFEELRNAWKSIKAFKTGKGKE